MNTFYFLGLTLILMHEMDAVRCREWRIFPGLSLLSDRPGFIVFLFAHIPLFYWVLVQVGSGNESFRLGFDYFLMIHVVLHILYLRHKNNLFKDWISWILIIGAGMSGLLDLIFK